MLFNICFENGSILFRKVMPFRNGLMRNFTNLIFENMAHNTVNEYIAAMPENQQLIAGALRNLILETAPELEESLKWGMPNYSKGKNIIYLAGQKNHVNFGFHDASFLNDPTNLLEGTGAKMRHVKIRTVENIPAEALRELVRQAVAGKKS
jgi:hypothetical protein